MSNQRSVIGVVFTKDDEQAVVELYPEHADKKIIAGDFTKAVRKKKYSNSEEVRKKRKEYSQSEEAKLKRQLYNQDPETKERIRERKLKTSIVNAGLKTLAKCLDLEKIFEEMSSNPDIEEDMIIDELSKSVKGDIEQLRIYVKNIGDMMNYTRDRIISLRESAKKRQNKKIKME